MQPACPLRLKKGRDAAIITGMPWIYAGDIIESSELLLAPPGSLVAIENQKGRFIGTGYYNARSQIACRVLTLAREPIDVAFFKARLARAMALRDKRIGVPYYRLAHSEADGLPGLLIDRFGELCVAQIGTAGMECLMPLWRAALEETLLPRALILRNDLAARAFEGLKQEVSVPYGEVAPLTEVHENGCIYLADLLRGQKTGWFYDQRDNRRLIAELASGKTLLDMYAHSGGFGLLVAKAGAARVTMGDSSKLALELAAMAAKRNDLAARCDYLQGDAFASMERLRQEGARFDIVLADPPAFVKSKKDIAAGMKGYEKVARHAAALVAPDGLLFIASCSHHASRAAFQKAVLGGIDKAGRKAVVVKHTNAAPDHPRHPQLPQSDYLKGLLLRFLP